MLTYVIKGLTLGIAAALQPGPFQAYLLSKSLKNGWKRTLPMALAPLISDSPIIILVIVILTQLPIWFQQVLQVAGGIFLLYLGIGAFRDFLHPQETEIDVESTGGSVLKAGILNLLNPNPYIFWISVGGPILVAGWRAGAAQGLGFLGSFYAVMISSLAIFIIVFGKVGEISAKANKTLSGIAALALLLFGAYLILSGTNIL
ncbi:MAG: LysE family transporter [Anaerolineales bacterium]|nr:LysE family transporter [Anaerolineales bacterium]